VANATAFNEDEKGFVGLTPEANFLKLYGRGLQIFLVSKCFPA
jgi:hypothetical protein